MRASILAVLVALPCAWASPAPAQEDPDPGSLLQRIESGDWAAHVDYMSREAMLLGYALGFTERWEGYCPGYRLTEAEALLVPSLYWRRFQLRGEVGQSFGDVIEGMVRGLAVDGTKLQAARMLGRSTADRLSEAGCGASSPAHRFATNAAHAAAGRRPRYGGPADRSLVDERVEPISSKHMYLTGYVSGLGSSLMALIESHYGAARSMGLTALICLYDTDPTSETYVKQIYWGPGFTQLMHSTGLFGWYVLPTFQRKLIESGAPPQTKHPMLKLGPARLECPLLPDENLPKGALYKPRDRIVRAPIDGSEVPEPEVRSGGMFKEYVYGRVPDDFMPPVPEWSDPCCDAVTMTKDGTGVLEKIQRMGNARMLPLGFNPFALPRPVEEDLVRTAGWQERDGEWVEGGPVYHFLLCFYTTERPGAHRIHAFWHETSPAWATREYLTARDADHPLLEVGPARGFCPATEAAAGRLVGAGL